MVVRARLSDAEPVPVERLDIVDVVETEVDCTVEVDFGNTEVDVVELDCEVVGGVGHTPSEHTPIVEKMPRSAIITPGSF